MLLHLIERDQFDFNSSHLNFEFPMMGSCNRKVESISMSRLRTLSLPVHSSSDYDDKPGCSTPPFGSSGSVPFKWEEEPGKPIPCTTLITYSESEPSSMKKLIPPPRMSFVESKVTYAPSPSPTTVLHGSSSSFAESSFDRLLGPMVSSREQKSKAKVGRRLFGSWSWGGRRGDMVREGSGGSFVFPSSASSGFDDWKECHSEYGGESESVGEQVKMGKAKKRRGFLNLTHVLPWKGSKLKNDGAC